MPESSKPIAWSMPSGPPPAVAVAAPARSHPAVSAAMTLRTKFPVGTNRTPFADRVGSAVKHRPTRKQYALAAVVVTILASGAGVAPAATPGASAAQPGAPTPAPTIAMAPAARRTATPIEHLIVVVGENLSFDNLF